MDDEVLSKLSELAQAQMAEARAKDALAKAENERASEFTRLRLSQERHNALLNLQTEQAGVLIDQARQMLEYIQQTAMIDDALRDWFSNLATRLERIDRVLILMLSPAGQREKSKLLEELELSQTEGEMINLKRQIIQYTRNRQKLYEKLAEYGTLDAPLSLTNQIDQTEAKINDLELKLKALEDDE